MTPKTIRFKNFFVKVLISFLLIIVLFTFFSKDQNVQASSYYYGPLDQIHYYEIKVNPNDDGTLNIDYRITWEVLDSTTDGPLTWVKIGIPNYHVKVLNYSDNVKHARYMSDGGAYVRLDLDKSYYKGDIVDFSFTIHQDYMYTIMGDWAVYKFTPGWFDDITVDKVKLMWMKDGVNVQYYNISQYTTEGDYYIFETTLPRGHKLNVTLDYEYSYFPNIDLGKTATDASVNPWTVFLVIFIIVSVIVCIIVAVDHHNKNKYCYEYNRGFMDRSYAYNPFFGYRTHHFHYHSPGVSKKGIKFTTTPAENRRAFFAGMGSSHGGGGSHCACACACACAGGGRAGCSKKDFYNSFDVYHFVQSDKSEDKQLEKEN